MPSHVEEGRLAGRVAIITGATAGIGRAAAQMFASEGAKVLLVGRNAVAGADVVATVGSDGGVARFVRADLTLDESAPRVAAEAIDAFGRIDVLYNNAGGTSAADGGVAAIGADVFWDVMRRELFSTWNLCHHIVPHMVRGGRGSIVNTVSGVAMRGRPGAHAYAAAKGAVLSLTRSMAAEYAPEVRVNAVSPTKVRTERVARLIEEGALTRTLERSNELLGWGEPIDVARAALFLASDEARMTTGHVLPVDSGTVMQ